MDDITGFLEDETLETSSKTSTSLNYVVNSDKESGFDLSSAGSHLQPGTVYLHGTPIVSLWIEGQERLCLAQISNTLLKPYSYNEIHNRRVALGITCVQCTPVQLELLRRAGAMPVSSRRCGMITRREAERLVKSFLDEIRPPKLPETFAFELYHKCGWGCRGKFFPARYNSSRAKCIQCTFCSAFFSPNKFIFHCHRPEETGQTDAEYRHPDAANFNAWRRHLFLGDGNPSEELIFAWEDVKAMFNGGNRKRVVKHSSRNSGSPTALSSSNDLDNGEDSSDSYMPEAKFGRMSSAVNETKNFSQDSERRLMRDNPFNYQTTTRASQQPTLKGTMMTGHSNLWPAFHSNKSQCSRAGSLYKSQVNQAFSLNQSPAPTEISSLETSRFKSAWPLLWARHIEMLQKSHSASSSVNSAVLKPPTIPYHNSMINNSFLAAHLLSQNLSTAASNCFNPNPIDLNPTGPAMCSMTPNQTSLASMQHFQMLQAGLPVMPTSNLFRSGDSDHSSGLKDIESATFLIDNKQLHDIKNHTIDSIIKNK